MVFAGALIQTLLKRLLCFDLKVLDDGNTPKPGNDQIDKERYCLPANDLYLVSFFRSFDDKQSKVPATAFSQSISDSITI